MGHSGWVQSEQGPLALQGLESRWPGRVFREYCAVKCSEKLAHKTDP